TVVARGMCWAHPNWMPRDQPEKQSGSKGAFRLEICVPILDLGNRHNFCKPANSTLLVLGCQRRKRWWTPRIISFHSCRDQFSMKKHLRTKIRTRSLFLENLETRAMLAGNVTAAVRGGTLFVTGDNADNAV